MKFYWPVRVSDGAFLAMNNLFGMNPEIYKQFNNDGHNGLDFVAPQGVPIYASIDGYVEFREDKNSDGTYKGFGKYARISSPEGWTYYAHCLKFEGSNGRDVKAGEVIGYVDSTGFSTGPHLHFGFRPLVHDLNNGFNGTVDPLPFLADESELPNMPQFKTQNYKGELRIVLQASTPQEWESLCHVYGVNPQQISEKIE